MRTLDRYLLREMLGPLMVALLGFVVLLVGHILYTAITTILQQRVPAELVLRFVLLQVPTAAVMALPVSTMLAIALTFNRMLRDNEVPIVRIGGVSLYRLLWPVVVAGAAATVISFAVDEGACRWAGDASRNLLVQVSVRRPEVALRSGQFIDAGRGFRILATYVDHKTGVIHDPLVYWVREGEDPVVFWAKQAFVVGERWVLRDVRVFVMARRPGPIEASTPMVQIRLPAVLQAPWFAAAAPSEMSLRELRRLMADQRQRGGTARSYELNYQRKLAEPFACLVLALLAGPMTLRFRHGGSLVGVLLTFVAVLVYFILMIWFQALGQQAILSPILAAWGPNALFGLAALALVVTQA
jgi:LPS export ABC transporter permease LptG